MIKKIKASAEELAAFQTISDMDCSGISCTECPVRISYIGRHKNDIYNTHDIMVCPKSLAADILVNLRIND